MIKDFIKSIVKLSPIALSKNHKYDRLTKRIINTLSKESNCIDVGCFKGEILDLMLSAAPNGQHFGIEPIPKQFEYLTHKYANREGCFLYNMAASNIKGQSSFNFVTSNPSYSGLKKRDYDRPNETDTTIQVKTDLLDNIIPNPIAIDLIKIDVEGAEFLVLEGASKIISRDKPLVIFEHGLGASNHYNTTPEHIFDFFASRSMKISILENFLNKKQSLSGEEFSLQFYKKKNYYFIAHP